MEFVYGKQELQSHSRAQEPCFLLSNGLGGYCSLSAVGSATRGDHALLMACLHAPTLRVNLVHRLKETLQVGDVSTALSTQDLAHREDETGWQQLQLFEAAPTPTWQYETQGVQVIRSIAMERGSNTVAVRYRIQNRSAVSCTLTVSPALRMTGKGGKLTRRRVFHLNEHTVTSGGLTLHFDTNGRVLPQETTFETLFYRHDAPDGRTATGLCAFNHDLVWEVPAGATEEAWIVYGTEPSLPSCEVLFAEQEKAHAKLLDSCDLQNEIARQLAVAADAFIVDRASTGGKTILAGYPFFTDWGRDTMIALPGCTLATGRFDDAKSILRTFLAHEKDGLMPNLFPENDAAPLYNTVDAALLFINCIWLYFHNTQDTALVQEAWPCMCHIIDCYRNGTHHGIHSDSDGLICAGAGLDQVTWMDVCINGHLPTPRHGKPVEINAYWYNALRIMEHLAPIVGQDGQRYAAMAEQVAVSFRQAFWMEDKGYLKDVISPTPSPADLQLRCNQIWAVSMPFTALTRRQAASVTAVVRRALYTPCGLRTLAPDDPEFHAVYGGPQSQRDLAYHQGTVWPFPLGGYYLAELRLSDFSAACRAQTARELKALSSALREGCIGQLPEIYDGAVPGPSRGCYAQAWSVGELLRVFEALEHPERLGLQKAWD